jgi:hypothetical protein
VQGEYALSRSGGGIHRAKERNGLTQNMKVVGNKKFKPG